MSSEGEAREGAERVEGTSTVYRAHPFGLNEKASPESAPPESEGVGLEWLELVPQANGRSDASGARTKSETRVPSERAMGDENVIAARRSRDSSASPYDAA